MNIVLTQQAEADLRRVRAFLAEINPSAAQRAVDALSRAIELLGAFPDRGRPSEVVGARELVIPFGRSAYLVRYRHVVEANEVVILRVWHGRERRD